MEYKIFGCKTNKYFTEKWLQTKYLDSQKGVFVASCIVTDKAKKKWLKFVISTIKAFQDEDERLFLSGCGTIKSGDLVMDFFETYPELLALKDKIVLLGEDPDKEGIQEKVEAFKKMNIFTRKYLIVQNGCDNHCTFCLTIKARGRHSSRTEDSIIEEINAYTGSGGKEIILTGTNLGAWGSTNTRIPEESGISRLIGSILEKTNIGRIRISSLGIEYLNDELISLFRKKRIYAHLHLSIQSGSDKILKSMNRNYNRKILLEKLEKINSIKRDDGIMLSIGADFIVGFPGETEDDFKDTLDIIRNHNITKTHAFPFSGHKESDRVPASLFPMQIDEKTKQERMKRILSEGAAMRDLFLRNNDGRDFELLVERSDGTSFSGWSQNYIQLNETNFIGESDMVKKGGVIKGVYRYAKDIESDEED